MQANEMTIGLGDDGWDPDMFETMRSAVGIHKLKQRNPSGFDMATASNGRQSAARQCWGWTTLSVVSRSASVVIS